MRKGLLVLLGALLAWDSFAAPSVQRIADNGSRTCRRPMAAGVFDPTTETVYACWSGPEMRPQVASYDVRRRKVIAVNDLLTPDRSSDFHDYPQIIQSADGVLHLFYSRHNKALYQVTAPGPHSMTGNWAVREVGNRLKATYPMPISDANGTLYVFYRITKDSDYRPMAYVRSRDQGKTWSHPVPAIDYGKTRRADHLDEIYVGALVPAAEQLFGEVFHCTWTLAGGGPERHDHDDYHKNMYHAYFRPSDGRWFSAAGADLGSVIDDTIAEKHCKVFDSGTLRGLNGSSEPMDIGYISKAVSVSNGFPVVVFTDGKRKSTVVSRWTGNRWESDIPALFRNRRGFQDLYTTGDLSELFVNLRANQGKIEVFHSVDGGITWVLHSTICAERKINMCTAIETPRRPVQLLQEINNGDWGAGDHKGTYRIWLAH